jgi:ATP-dependent Clp protease ATP-binding subunit ClpA
VFERFTAGARAVVEQAQAEARSLGHGYIGTEHLLLGLLGEGRGVAAQALRAAGVTAEAVRADVSRRVGDAVLDEADADALRAIGIDVAQVRARIEESFGLGALERARFGGCRRGSSRRYIPFSCRSKKVMELSLREALCLRHKHIGTEHILLALLREGEGLAVRILADSGVRAGDLRRSVLAALGKVA